MIACTWPLSSCNDQDHQKMLVFLHGTSMVQVDPPLDDQLAELKSHLSSLYSHLKPGDIKQKEKEILGATKHN